MSSIVSCQVWRAIDQPPRQFAFERDDRKAVAQQIMKVAGKPKTLLPYRQPCDLFARERQLLVRFDQEPAGYDRGSDDSIVDQVTTRLEQRHTANQVERASGERRYGDQGTGDAPAEGGADHHDR